MSDKPVEAVTDEQPTQPEYQFDPSTAPAIQHRWIDRGLKFSCEDAGHAHHEVWKRLPMQQ